MQVKIDWLNHGLSFGSGLVGILIAFQLQTCQDRRNDRERLDQAMMAIKKELNVNASTLKRDSEYLNRIFESTSLILQHVHTDSTFICNKIELDSIQKKFPHLLSNRPRKNLTGDKLEIAYRLDLTLIPSTVTTSAWESVKASGLLYSIPVDKMMGLNDLYSTLSANLSKGGLADFISLRNPNAQVSVLEINRVAFDLGYEYGLKSIVLQNSIDVISNY